MSKLIDKLRKTTQSAPRRLGFAPSAAEISVAAPILLLAELETIEASRVAEEASIGAEAIVWRATQPADLGTLAEAAKSVTVPIGVFLAEVAPEKWGELPNNGCDFAVAGAASPARALDLDALGTVLELSLDTDDLLLRTVEQLPVDAVLVREGIGQQGDLTIDRLMSFRRLILLVQKPVILPLSARLDSNELGLLRDAGIRGILVRDDSPEAHATVGALRQALNTVPPRKRRREERPEPILPPPVHPMEREESMSPAEPDEVPYTPDEG